jgi:hypothetical protein
MTLERIYEHLDGLIFLIIYCHIVQFAATAFLLGAIRRRLK